MVTGGTDGQGLVPDSELFDPLANSWEIVRNLHQDQNDGLMVNGQIVTARQLHTSTRLTGGSVLVAGGLGVERVDASGNPVFEALTTTFLFDPTTNKFTKTGSMVTGRWFHGAGRVGSGQVVLTAGLNNQVVSVANADVYEPASGTWAQVMTQDHHAHGSVVTLSTDVMVLGGAQIVPGQQGGMSIGGFPQNRCEKFGPDPAEATPAASIAADRMEMGAAVAQSGGMVLLAAGNVFDGQFLQTSNTTEVYDPVADAWTAGPTLGVARWKPVAAEIATTGDMLVIGGLDPSNALLVTCEVVSLGQSAVLGTVDMATPRMDFPAVGMGDKVLVIGGLDDQGAGLAQTEFLQRR